MKLRYTPDQSKRNSLDQGLLDYLYKEGVVGTILEVKASGPYYTPDKILELGAYNCSECNYINKIEAERCRNCNEEKFILKKND